MLNRTTTTYDSLGPDMKRSHLKAKQLPGTNIIGAPKKQATLTKFMGAPLLKCLAAFCVLDNVLGTPLGAVAPASEPVLPPWTSFYTGEQNILDTNSYHDFNLDGGFLARMHRAGISSTTTRADSCATASPAPRRRPPCRDSRPTKPTSTSSISLLRLRRLVGRLHQPSTATTASRSMASPSRTPSSKPDTPQTHPRRSEWPSPALTVRSSSPSPGSPGMSTSPACPSSR